MPLWLIWYPLLAAVNLFAFLAIRGRWGRAVFLLAAASLAGVAAGDWLAEAIGVEPLRIGDMNVIGASALAQLLMLVVTLLGALGPARPGDRRGV